MPLPTTTRRSLETAMRGLRSPSDTRRADVGRAPGRAPAALDARQADERQNRQRSKEQEAGLIVAGQLLRVAEAGGQVEAAEAARHADEASHDADLAPEPLRHELEHRAVAHAERQHPDHEDAERRPGLRQPDA